MDRIVDLYSIKLLLLVYNDRGPRNGRTSGAAVFVEERVSGTEAERQVQ